MQTFDLMTEYAETNGVPPDPEYPTPVLGKSLSLFHSCLVESDLESEEFGGKPRLTASPGDINPSHLSHFIVSFLPFNSVTSKNETNHVIFEVYSFLKWLEKRGISHGLAHINFQETVREMTSDQERCLQLSSLLDGESGKTLEDPPHIVNTIIDIFLVVKIQRNFIYLKGRKQDDVLRVRLPLEVLSLARVNDNLDLILGDTSEKWVILEAGQVYPLYAADHPSSSV